MVPAVVVAIEVDATTVEAEEHLTTEKVKKLKVAELKVELQQLFLSTNCNKAVLCNQLLESVVNNLPIFNAGGEGNEEGGTQVSFTNIENVWIPVSR